ncbi:MAG TPA: hypothetical protein VKU85_21455 [bacterium]|nr:hypothetical protein [bacterium]
MRRALLSSIAGAAALAAVPVLAEPELSFEAMIESGIPCPMEPGVGPVGASPELERVGAPTSRATTEPEILRGDDDLVTLRWRNVHARPVSEEIPILVEEGTVGLTVRAEAATRRFLISVELIGPDGTVLACHDCEDAPAVGEINAGRGATQMPSTDRPGWELTPGRYAFRVRALPHPQRPAPDEHGTDVDVIATLRSNAAADVEHFVDLNFVYLPTSTLSVDIAQTNPRFAEVMARVDDYLEPTGVRIGRITHHDLDLERYGTIATWEEAGDLFDTSGRLGVSRALNVYCVGAFEPPLLNVVGLSGGIPGPSINGTHDSGVIIRTSPMFICSNCVDAFASLFAHEFGHYFGLYHTTEANQQSADPFNDTPQCDQRSLRDCPDYDYVMFPLIHSFNTIWSPGQVEVVQSHPIVYTVPVLRSVAGEADPERPLRAHPNPFEQTVNLELPGAEPGMERAAVIYDVAGRRLREIAFRGDRLTWDGLDRAGKAVPGGVYFARVSEGSGARTVRIVKVR